MQYTGNSKLLFYNADNKEMMKKPMPRRQIITLPGATFCRMENIRLEKNLFLKRNTEIQEQKIHDLKRTYF